jgi:hypothetical protein
MRNQDGRPITLTVAPPFLPDHPHLGLAYLAQHAEHHGVAVAVYDFNIETYHRLPEERALWSPSSWSEWFEDGFADAFLRRHEQTLSRGLDELLAADPIALGFSVHIGNCHLTLALVDRIKERAPDLPILLGGPSFYTISTGEQTQVRAFGYPLRGDAERVRRFERYLEQVEAIVLGEGEETFLEVLSCIRERRPVEGTAGTACFRAGAHRVGPARPPIDDVDRLPFPTFRHFDLSRYTSRVLPILTTRGCPMRCTFCTEHRGWGRSVRWRSAEHVVSELKHHVREHHASDFLAVDMLLNAKLSELRRTCEQIVQERLDVSWRGSAVVHASMDAATFQLCRRAGLAALTFGLESGSARILKLMGKRFTLELGERNLRDCHAAGIDACVNIVVGFPGETEKDVHLTEAFLQRNRRTIDRVSLLSIFTLLHGSDVALRPEAYGLDPSQVASLPEEFQNGEWVDRWGLNFAERERRYNRVLRLLDELGQRPPDSHASFSLAAQRTLLADEQCWRWLAALCEPCELLGASLEDLLHLGLRHPQGPVRAGAARLAGLTGDARFCQHLVLGLDDDDDFVREMCARALGRLADPRYLVHLMPLMKRYEQLSDAFRRDLAPMYRIYRAQAPDDDG